jgi:hypothetical protein
MKNPFTKATWSPYVVGVGIGILSWITFLFMFKPLGTTTTFVRFVGFIVGIFSFEYVADSAYLSKYVAFKPAFEWQFALIVGIFVGAWVSAKLSGVTFSKIPYLWGQNFGFAPSSRKFGAFIGGSILMFGARMAGGCTLGHGVSGGLELATPSWLFVIVTFTSATIFAHILYRSGLNPSVKG